MIGTGYLVKGGRRLRVRLLQMRTDGDHLVVFIRSRSRDASVIVAVSTLPAPEAANDNACADNSKSTKGLMSR